MADFKARVILSVQKTPVLWDRKHTHHSNRAVLIENWKKLAEGFESDYKFVKRTWRNLRQEFSKQYKKYKYETANGDKHHKWTYFNSMLFLKDQFLDSKESINTTDIETKEFGESHFSHSNFTKSPSFQGPPSPYIEDSNLLNSPLNSGCRKASKPSLYSDSRNSSKSSLYSEYRNTSKSPLYSESKNASKLPLYSESKNSLKLPPSYSECRKRLIFETSVNERNNDSSNEEPNCKKVKMTNVQNDTGDEDIGFFNSVMPYVKKLDEENKMIFRIKIQRTLYELNYQKSSTAL